mgnify:CR=1 FL=1
MHIETTLIDESSHTAKLTVRTSRSQVLFGVNDDVFAAIEFIGGKLVVHLYNAEDEEPVVEFERKV